MLANISDMGLDPLDFLAEDGDPFRQLVERQRPQILLDGLGQRVLRPAGKEVILVHVGSVDRRWPAVNKARP